MKRIDLHSAMIRIAIQQNLKMEDFTSIEYEDGSGCRFNYKLMDGKPKFIDLSEVK